MDSAEAAQAGSANQPHEHGFGLIVEGVAGGDLVEGRLLSTLRLIRAQQTLKESIPQFPRRRLEAGMLMRSQFRSIIAFAIKFQPVLASRSLNEHLIRVGVSTAQFVIEMNDGKDDAEFVTKFEQQAQERDRIDSAGNRDAHTVSGLQEFVAPDEA